MINPLFHGTGIYCLSAIVESDLLLEGAHWGKPGEPHGPRLTSDYDIATSFIEYNSYCIEGGVLVLDRDLLAQDFSIVEYADKSYDGGNWGQDEREVVPIAPAIVDLSRYLISIVCDPHFIDLARDVSNVDLALSEGGWPLSFGEVGDPERVNKALDRLAQSPLLNRWIPDDGAFPRLGNWVAPTIQISQSPRG